MTPPPFRPWCPKCRRPRVSFEYDRRAQISIASCVICGWALYGADRITALVDVQRKEVEEPPPIDDRTEVTKEGPPVAPDWPMCAWVDCIDPVQEGRNKSPLKYCSKRCRLKNAHRREQERLKKK